MKHKYFTYSESAKKIIKSSSPIKRGVMVGKSSRFSTSKPNKFKNLFLVISGAVIGILNGFFGGGGGMVCVPILQKVLGLDSKSSHATAIAVIFPLSLISGAIYVYNGYIESSPLLYTTIGVVLGGVIGSYALKFLPPKAVRVIFALVMFAGGIRLII